MPAVIVLFLLVTCCKPEPDHGTMQLVRVSVGDITLSAGTTTENIPADASITVEFTSALDTASFRRYAVLQDGSGAELLTTVSFSSNLVMSTIDPVNNLDYLTDYTFVLGDKLKGINGEAFPGLEYPFKTQPGKLTLKSITLNSKPFNTANSLADIDNRQIRLIAEFSDPLNPANALPFFNFSGGAPVSGSISSDNKTVTFVNSGNLRDYTRYYFNISSNLTSSAGYPFAGFSNSFFTALDSTDKHARITDEELLDLVQRQTFKYFWDFGHPSCGLARERNTSGDIVTIGGSGFGVEALIVGIERSFITRDEGLNRMEKILTFLETCDRYHGAWPHWLNGATGKTVPFSTQDNGGDLVETSFMIQGLLTFRQYLNKGSDREAALIERIDQLWKSVEWTWFQNGRDVLFWHWSPNYNFNMNHQIRGYNETLITYVLAASSPDHPIPASAYHNGYASNGSIRNGRSFFGVLLPLGQDFGGPLFFTHYSFLGLDPRNLTDMYANYWTQNVNQSMINWKYCIANPKKYIGYSEDCWGLTASDNQSGYSAHSPTNDLGVITPTAAVSALPYVPEQSLKAIRHFYYLLGDKLWGPYGFYDAFNVSAGWWGDSNIAIDQGPIIIMIENYRTALLWNLFMTCPEVQAGLLKLGFTY